MSDGSTQQFQFDENEYARPNQRWHCGRTEEGLACPLGPTKRGACRAANECVPYQDGDTWVCARTRAQGGPCEEGPLPDGTCCRTIPRCQPKMSVMARRGVVSFFVFAFALGVALILVGSPARRNVVSPGRLNPQHSTVVQDCADCHPGGDGQLDDWIHAAFDSNAAMEQSNLCLKCHHDLGPRATSPHGMAAEDLETITARIEEGRESSSTPLLHTAGKSVFGSPAGQHGQVACATCHREHQGADFELVNTTNHQCQTCHTATFHSLGKGHPEFSQFPYERRSRLYFDHLSHYGKHFEEFGEGQFADRACNDCHQQDATGHYMLTRGFEQSCASCHAEQINDGLDQGLALVALPGLDVAVLQANNESGIDIGHWPNLYPLHVAADGQLAPVMKMLLLADDGFAESLRELEGLDLADLRNATPKQLKRVEELVWALKEALYDIVQGGQPAIRKRFAASLASQVSDADVAEWSRLFPTQLLRTLQQRWLPNLIAEVDARRDGQPLPPLSEVSSPDPKEVLNDELEAAKTTVAGWYLRDSDLSLRYRPTGHADPLLKLLLEISSDSLADRESDNQPQAMRQMFTSLSSPFATGRCVKCHTVDSNSPGNAQVNWFAYRPSSADHAFTRFNHSPHLTLLNNKACLSCHTFVEDEQPSRSLFRAEFFEPDGALCVNAKKFSSNFAGMRKSMCIECHKPSGARDSCVSCHNYHAE